MSARSEFLSLLVVGAKCEFKCDFWCPEWTERTITKRQTKRVAFTHPTKEADSWLELPKASEIRILKPGHFVIGDDDPRYELHYRFTNTQP